MVRLRDIRNFTGAVRRAAFSSRLSSSDAYSFWKDSRTGKLDCLVQHLSNTSHDERKIIRSILKDRRAKSVLDAACGPAVELDGYIENNLGVEYTGLDISKYLLNIARQKHPSARFVLGDVERLPFGDNSFDIVLLKHIVEHLRAYQSTIQEAVRVAHDSVIINLFHPLLPLGIDIRLQYRGYRDNWYSRGHLESFIDSLPISGWKSWATLGIKGNTATFYVLEK